MKHEYIIVDSNNKWLDTSSTLKEAKEMFSILIKNADAEYIYLYKAEEIKRFRNEEEE